MAAKDTVMEATAALLKYLTGPAVLLRKVIVREMKAGVSRVFVNGREKDGAYFQWEQNELTQTGQT